MTAAAFTIGALTGYLAACWWHRVGLCYGDQDTRP